MAKPPSKVMKPRRLMCAPSVRGVHPTTPLLEMPRCASQHFGPPDFRSGSFASFPPSRRTFGRCLRLCFSAGGDGGRRRLEL